MANFPLPADWCKAIVDFVNAKKPFAIATVLHDAGSTPRKAGTRAIFDASGVIWGTVGGGLMESQVQSLAIKSIETREVEVHEFRFAGESAAEDKPVCGGTMRILIDPVSHLHRQVFAMAAQATAARQRGALVTIVTGERPAKVQMEWLEGDEAHREFPGALVELIIPPPYLIVAGGGHVGQALVHAAVLAGFGTTVIEDRPEFSEARLFPPGVDIRRNDFAAELSAMPTDVDTYIALVSRNHMTDSRALAACIRKPAAYIGMMGSRRKIALVRKEFLEAKLAMIEELNRLYAPIGLDLGAQTVPEIAASIVAQMIAVRRKGSAPRLWQS